MPKNISILVTLLFAIPLSIHAAEDRPNERVARLILFVPDGSELPDNYQERFEELALRTEAFFHTELARNGWKDRRKEIFGRDDSGNIEVLVARGHLDPVKGRESSLPVVTGHAMDLIKSKFGENADSRGVYWTFYHCPDHEGMRGFRGGGGRDFGRAINRYPDVEGDIPIDAELGSQALWPMNIKGCVHEFGHALGLPHIGPKLEETNGNTLMGPINRAFAKRTEGQAFDERVYLSEASAAMLAFHPLFSKTHIEYSNANYSINLSGLTIEETEDKHIHVHGSASCTEDIHSVIALDSPRRFGDYWSRPYRAPVKENGDFSLLVDHPFEEAKGSLSVFFSLETGHNTTKGGREVLQQGVMTVQYTGKPGERSFTVQEGKKR